MSYAPHFSPPWHDIFDCSWEIEPPAIQHSAILASLEFVRAISRARRYLPFQRPTASRSHFYAYASICFAYYEWLPRSLAITYSFQPLRVNHRSTRLPLRWLRGYDCRNGNLRPLQFLDDCFLHSLLSRIITGFAELMIARFISLCAFSQTVSYDITSHASATRRSHKILSEGYLMRHSIRLSLRFRYW